MNSWWLLGGAGLVFTLHASASHFAAMAGEALSADSGFEGVPRQAD
jgi:hypothetical protein